MKTENLCYLIGAADFGFPENMGMPTAPGPDDTVICADAGMMNTGMMNTGRTDTGMKDADGKNVDGKGIDVSETGESKDVWHPNHLIGDFDSLEEARPGAGEELLRMYKGDSVRLDENGKPVGAVAKQIPASEIEKCDARTANGAFENQSSGRHLHILPPEKNITDLQAAWRLGQSLGFRNFVMTGCFGGRRFDHSLGNLHLLLSMAREGGNACACSKDLLVFPLLSGQTFDSERGILSAGDKAGSEDEETQTILLATGLTRKNRYLSLVPAEGDVCGVTIRGLKYELTDGMIPAGSTLGISNEILERTPFSIRVGSGSLWILISEK